jgi:pimeloyl-ACP methyl ester carboxylesterase
VAVGPVLAGFRLRDPARRAVLLAAVRACRDRLVGQGIDLGVYDLAAEASDMEDLRITLGIDKWNINTNGSANRVGFEVARQYPDGLRSIVVDSPNLPSPDFLTIGPAMLDLAISRLVIVCAAEPACARAFPDLDAMIRNAIARLDAEPVTVAVTGTVDAVRLGHPISVVVDGAALVRVIRFGLATGGGGGAARALTTIRDALDGKLTGSDGLVGALSSDTGDCLGLLPICERTNVGALYSILCRDYVARIDGTRLTASLDGRAAYADVFAPSPLLAPCTAWGVAPAEAASSGSLTGSVPILALRGTFDPFSATTSDVMTAAAGASNAYVLDVPNQSYNVLGHNECTLLIRNAWVDAPTTEPADTSCLAALPPFDFTR